MTDGRYKGEESKRKALFYRASLRVICSMFRKSAFLLLNGIHEQMSSTAELINISCHFCFDSEMNEMLLVSKDSSHNLTNKNTALTKKGRLFFCFSVFQSKRKRTEFVFKPTNIMTVEKGIVKRISKD